MDSLATFYGYCRTPSVCPSGSLESGGAPAGSGGTGWGIKPCMIGSVRLERDVEG